MSGTLGLLMTVQVMFRHGKIGMLGERCATEEPCANCLILPLRHFYPVEIDLRRAGVLRSYFYRFFSKKMEY